MVNKGMVSVLIAVGSMGIGAIAMYGYMAKKKEEEEDSIVVDPEAAEQRKHIQSVLCKKGMDAFDETLVKEQLSRNYAFLGEERMANVRASFVIVVGVGGVGSHAAHMLLRSGIKKIRLIDFDQVTLSSLNRHAVARLADVGLSKVKVMQEAFQAIAPWCEIEAIESLFQADEADALLAGHPDFVLDCIDNLDTKVDLLAYCHRHGIPVISSMGSGAKADPSRIQIADISETSEDSLARTTRRKLRDRGITQDIPVVFSTERPNDVSLLPLPDHIYAKGSEEARQYSALPDFRVRILPVLGTLPAMFGNAMAGYVLTTLARFPLEPLAAKNRTGTYARMLKRFASLERQTYGSTDRPLLTLADVGYILEECWRGRSCLVHAMPMGQKPHAQLSLVRWRRALPPSWTNIVVMTPAEAKRHEALTRHLPTFVLPKACLTEGMDGEPSAASIQKAIQHAAGSLSHPTTPPVSGATSPTLPATAPTFLVDDAEWDVLVGAYGEASVRQVEDRLSRFREIREAWLHL